MCWSPTGSNFFSLLGINKFSLSIEYSLFSLNIDDYQGSLIANAKKCTTNSNPLVPVPCRSFSIPGVAPTEVRLRLVMSGSNTTKCLVKMCCSKCSYGLSYIED